MHNQTSRVIEWTNHRVKKNDNNAMRKISNGAYKNKYLKKKKIFQARWSQSSAEVKRQNEFSRSSGLPVDHWLCATRLMGRYALPARLTTSVAVEHGCVSHLTQSQPRSIDTRQYVITLPRRGPADWKQFSCSSSTQEYPDFLMISSFSILQHW